MLLSLYFQSEFGLPSMWVAPFFESLGDYNIDERIGVTRERG